MAGSTGDKMDRGAILMYSNGANQKFGTKVKIVGGVVTATVSQIDADHPDNNKMGADDYVLAVMYSYTNGYGETAAITEGFSNNQVFLTGNGGNVGNTVTPGVNGGTLQLPAENPSGDLDDYTWSELKALAQTNLSADELRDTYGIEVGDYKEVNGIQYVLVDLDGNNYDGFVFMYNSGTTLQMNTSNSNAGGYGTYAMAQVEDLYRSMDTDLKNVIKAVKINYNEGNANYSTTPHHTTEPVHLFLASYKEVGFIANFDDPNTDTYYEGYQAEGNRFDYFIEGNSTDACNKRTAIYSSTWWLRSANSEAITKFYDTYVGGNVSSSNANNEYGIVPCFVIG